MSEKDDALNSAKEALARVQNFDPNSLEQADRLGRDFAFPEAIAPAERLIAAFQQLPISTLDIFPAPPLSEVRTQANSVYELFDQITAFDVSEPDARKRHDQAIERLEKQYDKVFSTLAPLVAYSMARTVDFNHLEEQGRVAVREIKDQAGELINSLASQNESAKEVLAEVRKAAAEQGVSQQAVYFKEEADRHKIEAKTWRDRTVWVAAFVGLYGLLLIFAHKVKWLSPSDLFGIVQLTTGKLVLFFILSFVLFLCSRNFLSNRHNEIVNRHRQNALMTYKALVDAGGTPETRDLVLGHAASAIYKLHDTGYAKASDGGGTSSNSVVEMLPRASFPVNTGSSGS